MGDPPKPPHQNLDDEKILDNFITPEIVADFLFIGEHPDQVMDGWIAADGTLTDLWALLIDEIEYTFQVQIERPEDYRLYNVELFPRYRLSEILDQITFQGIQMQPRIFLVVLHREVNPRRFERDPRFTEWIEATPPTFFEN